MDHETASLLTTLRVAGAPLLASLPLELLYGIFAAGGLEEAQGWRFEEQRKTDRSLIVDAVCMVANFANNTHAEGDCYRLEGDPCKTTEWIDGWPYYAEVVVPRLCVTNCIGFSTAHGYYYGHPLTSETCKTWHWSEVLKEDSLFQSLLKTRQMCEWLKHCEEHFCR